MGMELEALDSLIQGVARYETIYNKAVAYGVTNEVQQSYEMILMNLQNQYGLSKEDVDEIIGYGDDATYTRRLRAIIDGTGFVLDPYTDMYAEQYGLVEGYISSDEGPQQLMLEDEETPEIADESQNYSEGDDYSENPIDYSSEGQQLQFGADESNQQEQEDYQQYDDSSNSGKQVNGIKQPINVVVR